MATMQCDVVSVKESIYSGAVTMLIAKGAGGELGILPGHAPLVTLLQPGPIRVLLENGTEEIVYVSGGVLEVQPHVVTVLADTAIRADNLDEAAILEARKMLNNCLQTKRVIWTQLLLWHLFQRSQASSKQSVKSKPRSIRRGSRLKSHLTVAFYC